jgi:hypothetical protein
MKISKLKWGVIIGICSIFNVNTNAQTNDCDESLVEAYRDYEAGNFEICIERIAPCKNNFSKETTFEAFRLLALCNLQLTQETELHNNIIGLLKSKPEYKNFPLFDPLEFKRTLDKYEVWPRMEVGVKAGFNVNSIRTIQNHSVTGTPAYYSPTLGFQSGIKAEYFIKQNLAINAEVLYEGISYRRTSDDVQQWKQEFTEKLKYVSIPIMVNYYFYETGIWKVSGSVGLQVQSLRNTNSSILLTKIENGREVQRTASQLDQRNKLNFALLAGATVKRKTGGGSIIADLRFGYGLSNVVNPDTRYQNLPFIMDNQYVDSDIAFMPLYISFGYQLALGNMYVVKKVR